MSRQREIRGGICRLPTPDVGSLWLHTLDGDGIDGEIVVTPDEAKRVIEVLAQLLGEHEKAKREEQPEVKA